jgi:hypothetical protein
VTACLDRQIKTVIEPFHFIFNYVMKKILVILATVSILATGCRQGEKPVTPSTRWTPEEATAWYAEQGWRSGCNYVPATAVNQIEMWSADTYDHA